MLAEAAAGQAAVGERVTVILDGGVRRGPDILIAVCLAARFVFVGRPTLYSAAAGGISGVKRRSTSSATKLISFWARTAVRPLVNERGPDFLWRDDWTVNR